jgi:NAD(P)-dependent dehydrogenase (short-subunit alcohol dehydrogenase family)
MSEQKNILIIGASRGLGLGLAQRFSEAGWKVTATVRDPSAPGALQAVPGVAIEALEMRDVATMDALAQRLQGQVFDVVFINAGIMGPTGDTDGASEAAIGELFTINAVAPIRLAKRLLPLVRERDGVLAFMSSVLGSVTMPEGLEVALYKASKAALNSTTSTFVSGLGETGLTVLSMHPGWVKTDMGGEGASIDVLTSTTGLFEQLQAQAGRGGHRFIDYQGNTIDW